MSIDFCTPQGAITTVLSGFLAPSGCPFIYIYQAGAQRTLGAVASALQIHRLHGPRTSSNPLRRLHPPRLSPFAPFTVRRRRPFGHRSLGTSYRGHSGKLRRLSGVSLSASVRRYFEPINRGTTTMFRLCPPTCVYSLSVPASIPLIASSRLNVQLVSREPPPPIASMREYGSCRSDFLMHRTSRSSVNKPISFSLGVPGLPRQSDNTLHLRPTPFSWNPVAGCMNPSPVRTLPASGPTTRVTKLHGAHPLHQVHQVHDLHPVHHVHQVHHVHYPVHLLHYQERIDAERDLDDGPDKARAVQATDKVLLDAPWPISQPACEAPRCIVPVDGQDVEREWEPKAA